MSTSTSVSHLLMVSVATLCVQEVWMTSQPAWNTREMMLASRLNVIRNDQDACVVVTIADGPRQNYLHSKAINLGDTFSVNFQLRTVPNARQSAADFLNAKSIDVFQTYGQNSAGFTLSKTDSGLFNVTGVAAGNGDACTLTCNVPSTAPLTPNYIINRSTVRVTWITTLDITAQDDSKLSVGKLSRVILREPGVQEDIAEKIVFFIMRNSA